MLLQPLVKWGYRGPSHARIQVVKVMADVCSVKAISDGVSLLTLFFSEEQYFQEVTASLWT